MPAKNIGRATTLTDEELCQGVRYILQLAIEWQVDGAAYEKGGILLERVVADLAEHRRRRETLRERALIAEIVEPTMDQLFIEKSSKRDTVRDAIQVKLSRWLRSRGVAASEARVEKLLADVYGPAEAFKRARGRTRQERLVAGLGAIIGTSQSDLERLVRVSSEECAKKEGKLSNALLADVAASDHSPSPEELLLYALHAVALKGRKGRSIADVLLYGRPIPVDEQGERQLMELVPTEFEDAHELRVKRAEMYRAGMEQIAKRSGPNPQVAGSKRTKSAPADKVRSTKGRSEAKTVNAKRKVNRAKV